MKLRSITAAVVVLFALGAIVATGAVLGTAGSPTENLFNGEPDVEFGATNGTNGNYVVSDDDGELRIDLTDPGVNAEAYTTVDRIFYLHNQDTQEVLVWVTHDGGERVSMTSDEGGAPIEGEENAVTLAPGERVVVNVGLDSQGIEEGDRLLTSVTIHTGYELEEEVGDGNDTDENASDGGPGTPGSGGGGGGGGGVGVPGEETPETTPDEESEQGEPGEEGEQPEGDAPGEDVIDSETGVEVEFEGEPDEDGTADADGGEGSDAGITVRELSNEDLDAIDATARDGNPRAVISTAEDEDGDGVNDESDGSEGDAIDLAEGTIVTTVGEPTRLSGERSTISVSSGVTEQDRIVRAVDIEPPENRRNQPATVRLRVDRDRFGDADPSGATLGHRTENGWELLDTTVTETNENYVVVSARTRSFSPFAVFVNPDVTYQWTLPDGTTQSGRVLEYTFAEPGQYDVGLTVRDALGRESTATRTVIANDVPTAEVSAEYDRAAEMATLTADVTNEVGDATVTWTFADGTTKTGETITHPLEPGEHVVDVRVADEYGAATETTERIAVATGWSVVSELSALGIGSTILWQTLLSLTALGLIVAAYRYVPWGRAVPEGRGPRITTFEDPRVSLETNRFAIGSLSVIDPQVALDTVTITVVDGDGDEVVRKRLEIVGDREYETTDETIVVPPGTALDSDESYRIRVTARNVRDRTGTHNGTSVRVVEALTNPVPSV
ncbi:PGF-pre-PGF domain-containing protein [Halopenitus malekzadehii]|uniref:PGF-pre-PGF domain-containing protein n=1 Tax=Halopenitus malekzadehii TaxID=1267564 RepID=A0A1H6HZC2_9EURY|nr:PKD domain-containing protein [Halopenitus malekzadehii]SEH39666.1 PGF-pre-PGF domain-containing protein [Halopenitus malekzadehii]